MKAFSLVPGTDQASRLSQNWEAFGKEMATLGK